MSVKETLLSLQEAQKVVSTDPKSIPLNVRPGFLIRQTEAAEKLKLLTAKVEQETIPGRLVGVFASGEVPEALYTFLMENGGIILPADAVYRLLEVQVNPTMASDVFRTSSFHRLTMAYQGLANIMGIQPPPYLEYVEASDLRTPQQVQDHIRLIVRKACGDAFTIRWMRDYILSKVVESCLQDKNIPVLVLKSRDDDRPAIAGLFSRSSIQTIPADFEATSDKVVAIFRKRA